MNAKDFDTWNGLKKQIDSASERLYFHEREVWACHLGENIGSEQDGRGDGFLRPIIVLRKFNNEIFWGVPLTRTKKKSPFYFAFTLAGSESSSAILSQLRLTDAKRLRRKIGVISKQEFASLKEKLKALLP